MSGQRAVLRTMLGRMAIGLLVIAAAGLLAPVAVATPESDANDAINAAYDAAGGPTGPLGPKDGDVYPAGDGFGQNFRWRQDLLHPGHRRPYHDRRDSGQVHVARRARRR